MNRKKRTVVKTPKTDRACRPWTEEMREATYRAAVAGVSAQDLSILTGRTVDAVKQQVWIARRKDLQVVDPLFIDDFRLTEGSPKGDNS
jgi:hypothetical protein